MQWSRRETKTLKLQQATEELGRERTAGVTTMARLPHATPSRVATPCFHILARKSKTSLESCFFKPRKLLLASIKPP